MRTPRSACYWQAVRPTSRTRHVDVRPSYLQASMPREGRWRGCALNCCWLKYVPHRKICGPDDPCSITSAE